MAEIGAQTTPKPALAGNTDTSLLKVVALFFMIIDHVGVSFFPAVMEFRVFGRIAMPLYAWCLVVGCEYTHNALAYAARLLVLGVVSQPFYVVALNNSWSHLNILFLLSLGVLSIAGIKEKRWYSQYWAPALCLVVVLVLDIDYGWRGLFFILLLYASRTSRSGIVAAFLAAALYWGSVSFGVRSLFGMDLAFPQGSFLSSILQPFFQMQAMMWMAVPLILIPTRSTLKLPKWLGYGLYPMHLAALIIIMLLLGVPLSSIIAPLTRF